MYMTMRRLHTTPGGVPKMLEVGLPLIEKMNSRFGTQFSVAVNIGTDPDAIGLAAPWENMAAYQAYRDALMADTDLSAEAAAAGAMAIDSHDVIGYVMTPPGDPQPFSLLAEANMQMPRVAEAVAFGLEVCEFVETKTGVKTGFITATTGDRSAVAWTSRHPDLNTMAEVGETLEADPEYLDFFKRSENLFVDGSLVQTWWQRVN